VENVTYGGQAPRRAANQPGQRPAITTTSIGDAYEPEEAAPQPQSQPQPETGPRAPRRSPSSWAPAGESTGQRVEYVPGSSIIHKRAITPFNIIEPLDWLIESMRREPPRVTAHHKKA
jgi:hypothetical protein